MRGMLLAAGLGTRLRPLTDERPKPAVPFALRPMAASAIDTFAGARITRIDVNAHHLPDALESALAPEFERFAEVHVHREPKLLGTAGGIANATRGTTEPVLVMNGDIRFSPDVHALVAAHRRAGGLATLVVRGHSDPDRLGAVEVDEAGYVVRIAGAPGERRPGTRPFVFTGVHILEPTLIADLPSEGCIVRAVYQKLLARGAKLAAHIDDSPWADLGTLADYGAAHRALLGNGSVIASDAVVGAGATVERSVVGPGAHVAPGVRVADSVVWPYARIVEDIEGVAFTSQGRIVKIR